MQGFFSASSLIKKQPVGLIPKCGSCGFNKTCNWPKPEVYGKGRKRILLITDNTTKSEDEAGRHLVGKTSDILHRLFGNEGIDIKIDCWKTSAVICHSDKAETKHVDFCNPNIKKIAREKDPDIIIPMGTLAIRSVLQDAWKEDTDSWRIWAGHKIPCTNPNAWICPLYPASYLLEQREKVAENWLATHLEGIAKLKGKPWPDGPPDWRDSIELITNPDKAAKAIKLLSKDCKRAAFDYEANALKPETPGFKVYSCSVCFDGKKTIAYPWRGKAVGATKEFLYDPKIGKIAANLKYEDRVSRFLFGDQVASWVWDTMQAAHVLDCRKGTTSLKFQSFVHLGQSVYNAHIERFLKGRDGSRVNDIHLIETEDLLYYNGLDSLLEYKLAIHQAKQMNMKSWWKSNGK